MPGRLLLNLFGRFRKITKRQNDGCTLVICVGDNIQNLDLECYNNFPNLKSLTIKSSSEECVSLGFMILTCIMINFNVESFHYLAATCQVNRVNQRD